MCDMVRAFESRHFGIWHKTANEKKGKKEQESKRKPLPKQVM